MSAPVNSVALNLEAQLRAVVRERDDLRARLAAPVAVPVAMPDASVQPEIDRAVAEAVAPLKRANLELTRVNAEQRLQIGRLDTALSRAKVQPDSGRDAALEVNRYARCLAAISDLDRIGMQLAADLCHLPVVSASSKRNSDFLARQDFMDLVVKWRDAWTENSKARAPIDRDYLAAHPANVAQVGELSDAQIDNACSEVSHSDHQDDVNRTGAVGNSRLYFATVPGDKS